MPFTNAKLYKKGPGRPRKGYTKLGKKKGRASVPKLVKEFVKASISRKQENKTQEFYDASVALSRYGHANFIATNIRPVSPFGSNLSIIQGTSQGARIGNQITCKRLMFRGTIIPNTYNVTTNPVPKPQMVVMWILYDREVPTTDPVIGTDFLQLGGSTQALTNTLTDVTAPLNNDRYRLLTKRVFKVGYASYGGTGTQAAAQSFTNNDYKLNCMFRINLTKYMIKKIKFNDNNATPTSRGLFYVIQPVNADGSLGTAATDIPCYLSYTLEIDYEDA